LLSELEDDTWCSHTTVISPLCCMR